MLLNEDIVTTFHILLAVEIIPFIGPVGQAQFTDL